MLRSRFVTSSASTAPLLATANTVVANNSTALRTIFAFTQQSPVLQNNAKHLKYKSNIWVEEADKYWWSKVTELKSDKERPTQISTQRLIEYYNLECLADPTQLEGYSEFVASNDINSITQHSSWRTKLPFKGNLAKDFEAAANIHSYTQSKLWVTAQEVRKQNLQLGRPARVTGVCINAPMNFFNADQFKNPDAISKLPISGYKRRQFGGNFAGVLSADMKQNGYKTGLYFTAAQLEHFGLSGDLKPNAEAVKVPLTDLRGNKSLFNLEQVKDYKKFAESLNRFPIDVDTYVVSGRPVAHKDTLEKLKEARKINKFKSNYWVSENDLKSRGFELADSVDKEKDGVEFQFSNTNNADGTPRTSYDRSVELYNVDQLSQPDWGFAIAGTKGVL